MGYKIEGRGQGGDWNEDYVGNDMEANTFATEAEALAEIPKLAQIFDCDEADFRVVER